jgi:hypothetical protein
MDQFINHPLYRRHTIDSAMSSLWDFYKHRFLVLFIVSLVLSLVTQYASTMVNFRELQTITDPMLMLEKMKGYLIPLLLLALINLLCSTILQYYIIYNPLDSRTTIFSAALRSFKFYIPYLIILVLLAFAGSVAIILGVFLLIVGAFFAILYVMTLYLLILPVMMAENTNIADTIKRTFTLAHRNFWQNLGWVAVFIIILVVISVLLSGIILIPFTGSFIKTISNPESASDVLNFATNPVFIFLSAIINAITFPLMPVFACILYFNGKASEESLFNGSDQSTDNYRVKVEDLYAKPYSDDNPDNTEKDLFSKPQ